MEARLRANTCNGHTERNKAKSSTKDKEEKRREESLEALKKKPTTTLSILLCSFLTSCALYIMFLPQTSAAWFLPQIHHYYVCSFLTQQCSCFMPTTRYQMLLPCIPMRLPHIHNQISTPHKAAAPAAPSPSSAASRGRKQRYLAAARAWQGCVSSRPVRYIHHAQTSLHTGPVL
ncbi:hypothetical protein EJ06DRAFT_63916 [Trichodelitschia bisporula]|uniref:Uncharacterized protein n=1 Tax=Trichodelitschia bisporula TaxID=703511 RepID=A0A6G1HSY7_9PEZI|nr:hypothetical protein EJ06DRAFT_63916 [Trichodelitschia bisporula]